MIRCQQNSNQVGSTARHIEACVGACAPCINESMAVPVPLLDVLVSAEWQALPETETPTAGAHSTLLDESTPAQCQAWWQH
mmetsp:Transcript_18878/g.52872  ORF Transcript_18878/g.52872 Transcript_18878/m.52872 type:complete len:81 (+) Transcript_18878:2390-2632(+)